MERINNAIGRLKGANERDDQPAGVSAALELVAVGLGALVRIADALEGIQVGLGDTGQNVGEQLTLIQGDIRELRAPLRGLDEGMGFLGQCFSSSAPFPVRVES